MGLFTGNQPQQQRGPFNSAGGTDSFMGPWGQGFQHPASAQQPMWNPGGANSHPAMTAGMMGSAPQQPPMQQGAGTNYMQTNGRGGGITAGGQSYGGLAGQQSNPNMIQPFSAGPYAPPSTNTGLGSITTSVQPTPIYSPQQTQQAVNQARATADQMADPRWQQKQFMTPGRSMDAGTMGAAMPGIASALFNGQQQAAQIPLMDAFANQQQMLNGQIGQQQESTGLANALAQFNENNIYQQNSMLNPLLSLFGNYMGG